MIHECEVVGGKGIGRGHRSNQSKPAPICDYGSEHIRFHKRRRDSMTSRVMDPAPFS